MLTIRHVTEGRVERIALADLEQALAGEGFVWLDVSDPTPDDEAVLDHPALGLSHLVIEDMREDVHLPKLDLYPDYLLLTVHALELETSTVELSTCELDCVLGHRVLITYHPRPLSAVEAVAQHVDASAEGLDRATRVLHALLDVMNDVYVPFLDLLGRRLELVEEDVLGRPRQAARAEIFALRRDLITLRRISVPQAEVIRRLGRDQITVIPASERPYFSDVYDHLFRMAEVSEVYRQLVESAYDTYRSVRDDETNRRLTVLTMVSALLLPITTIAGVYGMNFEYMPELERRYAYPLVLIGFAVIIVVGLLVFRAWGWIGRGEDATVVQRRRLAERVEIPRLGTILKVPEYGARFAVRSGRAVAEQLTGRGRRRARRAGRVRGQGS